MDKQSTIILISPVGKRDPWAEWEKQPRQSSETYGACLEILKEYGDRIHKVIFLPTQKTNEARTLIEKEMRQSFPDISFAWESTGIENASDYREIEEKLHKILDKYRFRDEQTTVVYVNMSSATPQISKYLEALLTLGYWGKPFQHAYPVEVKDPQYVPENRVSIRHKAQHDPVKSLIDASHIAQLIQSYEYSAARRISESCSFKIEPSLQFLKNLMDINIAKISGDFSLLKPALKQCFLEFFPNMEDEERTIEALAYWTMLIKFKRQEWQDMIIRLSALREYLALDCLKKLPCYQSPYFTMAGGRNFFQACLLSENERGRLIDVGARYYGKDYRWKDSIELTAEPCCILLTFFDHPLASQFADLRDVVGFRNRFAHSVDALTEIPKLKSFEKKAIQLMKAVRPEECNLWEQNFFDAANKALLKDFKLEWMIEDKHQKPSVLAGVC